MGGGLPHWLGRLATLSECLPIMATQGVDKTSPRSEPAEDRYPLHSSRVGDSRRSTCGRRAPGYALRYESAFIGPTHAAFFLACLFFVPK